MIAAASTTNSYIVPQVLTLAIPLGTFCVALLWGYFARYRRR
jgi:hypothetical protein